MPARAVQMDRNTLRVEENPTILEATALANNDAATALPTGQNSHSEVGVDVTPRLDGSAIYGDGSSISEPLTVSPQLDAC